MRKFLLIFLAVLTTAALTLGLEACGNAKTQTKEYNVTFNYNYEGCPAPSVLKTEGGEVKYISDPTRAGHEFIGWYKDAAGTQPFGGGKVTSDITLYAKWEAEKATYTVTYMVGGEVYDTVSAKGGESITLKSYSAPADKRFEGWTSDGKTYAAGDKFEVNANVTFTASLVQLRLISFVVGNETVKTVYMAKGEQITLPTADELSIGEGFIGWSASLTDANVIIGGEEYTLETSDDVTFYARFGGSYTLSFSIGYDDGGESLLPSDNYYNGSSVTLPAAPEREGYRFGGWSDGDNVFDAESSYIMPAADITLTAQWVKQWTVTFHYNYEGSEDVYDVIYVDDNTSVQRPLNPTRSEHKFVNWYADAALESTFRFTKNITEDTDAYAGWRHNYFLFTLTPDGGGYYLSHADTPDFTGIPAGSDLVIPKTYDGLPVVSLLPVSFTDDGNGHRVGAMSSIWKLFTINNTLKSPFVSITIPDTWTEIPDGAFGVCSDTLTKVNFENAENITRIGDYAFYLCEMLEDIDVPATVTELGQGAFYGCRILKEVDLGNCTIEELPYASFRGCYGLRSFKFPKGLKKIGDNAFNGAFLHASGDLAYHDDSEMFELLNSRTTYDVDSGYADIVIPEGVTYIGMWAFANETGINDMVNEPADTKFDEIQVNYSRWGTSGVTYYNFFFSHLRSVVLPSTVEYLGRGAFAWCENLEKVTFTPGYRDDILRDYVFYATALEEAVFPEGIKQIEKAAFMHCDNLKTVAVPSTVQYIGRRVFAYTSGLNTVTFAKGIDLKLYYIGDSGLVDSGAIFDHSGITSIEIPASVDILPRVMFQSCERLTTVTFEQDSKLVYIMSNAFLNAGITAITIPETIEIIGSQAFMNTQLTEIRIPANLSNGDLSTGTTGGDSNRLGWYAFADNKKLERVILAEDSNLEVLSFRVFQNCTALTEVVLSNNLRSVNGTYAKTAYDDPATPDVEGTIWTSNAFNGCTALEKITVPQANPYIIADGYALYSRTDKEGEYVNLDWYSQAQVAGGEVTVKEGIETLYEYVFSENKYITKLNLPASLKVIGIAACRAMTALEEVVFAADSKLEMIDNYAFGNITTYPTITSDSGFESTDYTKPPLKTPFKGIVFTGMTAPKLGANILVWSTENPAFALKVPAAAVESYKKEFSAFTKFIKGV